jgi:ankyrin repeat protein
MLLTFKDFSIFNVFFLKEETSCQSINMSDENNENNENNAADEDELAIENSDEIESNADLIEVSFEEGPLGITLRRRPEDGVVFVYDIIPESQAVRLNIKLNDELWAIGDIEIGVTPLDKEAWDGLIRHIKQSARPLNMTWKRFKSTDDTENTDKIENIDSVEDSVEVVDVVHSPSFVHLKSIVDRLFIKEEKNNFVNSLAGVNSVPVTRRNSNLSNELSSLLKEGRSIIKIGSLFVPAKAALGWVTQTRKKFILLSDTLIITTPQNNDKLQVDHIIDLQTCKIRSNGQVFGGSNDGEQNNDVMFQIIFPGASIDVFAENKEVKEVWVLSIFLAICECVGQSERVLGWRHQYMLGTIHSAVLARDEARVRELIQQCELGHIDFASIEAQDEDGYTPLHYAVILRIHNIIRLLHEATADAKAPDIRGLTPLHWAALLLDDYALTLLTEQVVDIDLLDNENRTPLYLACVEGRDVNGKSNPVILKKCVACLLARRSKVDLCDKQGRTLVHYLAASWQFDSMNLLIEEGVDPRIIDNSPDKRTSLHYAANATPLKLAISESIVLLDKIGIAPSSSTALLMSNNNDAESGFNFEIKEELNRPFGASTLRSLLNAGARPNFKDGNGKTALSIITQPEQAQLWGEEWIDAIAVLMAFGARVEDPVSLKNRCPEINFAAFAEKWSSVPVVNGDGIDIK